MLKDTGYKEKFLLINHWLEEIILAVKKDLRQEHLRLDKAFCRRYFLGKNTEQVSPAEMAQAYAQEIESGNVGLGEFIATRWLLKNTDIYSFFETRLRALTKDFETIEILPEDMSKEILKESLSQFGAERTYIFSIFNSVVFPESLYKELEQSAKLESVTQKESLEKAQEFHSLDQLKKRHTREVTAMQDRYEKKLSGMQKKYLTDTEKLKEQLSNLQRKISDVYQKSDPA